MSRKWIVIIQILLSFLLPACMFSRHEVKHQPATNISAAVSQAVASPSPNPQWPDIWKMFQLNRTGVVVYVIFDVSSSSTGTNTLRESLIQQVPQSFRISHLSPPDDEIHLVFFDASQYIDVPLPKRYDDKLVQDLLRRRLMPVAQNWGTPMGSLLLSLSDSLTLRPDANIVVIIASDLNDEPVNPNPFHKLNLSLKIVKTFEASSKHVSNVIFTGVRPGNETKLTFSPDYRKKVEIINSETASLSKLSPTWGDVVPQAVDAARHPKSTKHIKEGV